MDIVECSLDKCLELLLGEKCSLFHPQAQEQWRDAVREKATDLTMKEALCRILPVPCKEHHTAVALMPRAPRLQQLLATLCKAEQSLSAESKVNVVFFYFFQVLDFSKRGAAAHVPRWYSAWHLHFPFHQQIHSKYTLSMHVFGLQVALVAAGFVVAGAVVWRYASRPHWRSSIQISGVPAGTEADIAKWALSCKKLGM